MYAEAIEAIAYSGRKGDERPKTFILHGLRIDVSEIVEHWIEEGYTDRIRKRYFKLKGSDGNTHRIFYDESNLRWFYSSGDRAHAVRP